MENLCVIRHDDSVLYMQTHNLCECLCLYESVRRRIFVFCKLCVCVSSVCLYMCVFLCVWFQDIEWCLSCYVYCTHSTHTHTSVVCVMPNIALGLISCTGTCVYLQRARSNNLEVEVTLKQLWSDQPPTCNSHWHFTWPLIAPKGDHTRLPAQLSATFPHLMSF